MDFLIKIISMFDGNKSALVSALTALRPDSKVTNTHINNWLNRDKKVPAEWVLPLAECVQWQITPHQLRPDLYRNHDDGLPPHMRCDCERAA